MRPADNPKNFVSSLLKGLRVLEAFSATESALTLAEIARRAGLDNGTTFRLLNTLEHAGYLGRDEDGKRFRLTFKVLDLGYHALGRMDLRELARPHLRSLVGALSEAASLSVLDGVDMVYLERVQAGLARLGVDVHPGSRVPAFASAAGQAALAFLPPAEAKRIITASRRVRLTERTLIDPAAIEARLAFIRERGYALADQEVATGLRVLAAPVLDGSGCAVAVLSVAAPSLRTDLASFEREVAPAVTAAAGTLGKAFAARGIVSVPAAPGRRRAR